VIALILEDRCTACGICVDVCPTTVLVAAPAEVPHIADHDNCQTCFACELYCPVDAIYVDPDCEAPVAVDEAAVRAAPSLGQYRRDAGWGDDPDVHPNEFWRMDRMFGIALGQVVHDGSSTSDRERPAKPGR
jgi:NAD-dependent dihydropyrimidine dehydrogenase PreA subunit